MQNVPRIGNFKSVLIIGDTHLPFVHFQYLDFLICVREKYKTEVTIHIGDYEDQHAVSFHKSDSALFNADQELEKVIEMTIDWYKAFPRMKIIDSNHGSLIYRRLKVEGIPLAHIKKIGEIYNTPLWTWHEDLFLQTRRGDVYITHGKSSGYNKLAREVGCSAVQGHAHSKFEITYANSVFHERFNAFTGCGIDRDSLAFAYGKNNIPHPILGCLVIDENGVPHLCKMHMDKDNKWDGLV